MKNVYRADTANAVDWLLKNCRDKRWDLIERAFKRMEKEIMNKHLAVKRLHSDAKLPTKAYEGDAGYDLYSLEDSKILPGEISKISTGICIRIPEGHSGFIWDRSGNGSKGIKVYGGVIDQTYTGEIFVCLGYNGNRNALQVSKGDKIAQLCIFKTPHFDILEVDKLELTERGGKGFGSSG